MRSNKLRELDTDRILVMEDKHRKRILADFQDASRFKPIRVLDIPDEYKFMDAELVEFVRSSAGPLIDEHVGFCNPRSDHD